MAVVPLDALRELMRHMEWADACVWRAVLSHPAVPSDARLRDLLLHIHDVQRSFLAIWTSTPIDPLPDAAWNPASAQAAARAYYRDLESALTRVDDAMLLRPVVMPWVELFERETGRKFATPTLGETMLQVASHSTYHRGQVNARLRELGGEPPLVDYIAWIWFGRPAPEWLVAASGGEG